MTLEYCRSNPYLEVEGIWEKKEDVSEGNILNWLGTEVKTKNKDMRTHEDLKRLGEMLVKKIAYIFSDLLHGLPVFCKEWELTKGK